MKVICKEIDDYIDYVEKNPKKINKKRHLLIKNIVKPLLKRDDIFFDKDTYEKCLRYCQTHFYKLFPYQKFIYAFVFMYLNDVPIFRKIVVIMGRGNGKDGFIMPLVNFLQTPLYGVRNYNIDIVANNESQAKDTFQVVYDMLDSNKKLKKKFYVSLEKIYNFATRSRLRYNTSNAKTKDGKKTGANLFNEYHAYEDSSQVNVFDSGLGKIRHPRTFIISTNGYVRGGAFDELMDVCNEIVETGENPLGYFPFVCTLDNKEEVDIDAAWIKANPSIEYMPVLAEEIRSAYLEMQKFPSKRAEFVTKRMNMPERNEGTSVASWNKILRMSYEDIEKKTERVIPNLVGKNAVVGIDYADIRDFASAGFLFKIDGEYIWIQKTWVCKSSPFFNDIKFPLANFGQKEFMDFEVVDDNSLSAYMIVEWVLEQGKKYNIQKIVMDNFRFGLFRKVFEEYGIDVEHHKDNPFGLVRMIRYSKSINNLTAPLIEKSIADEIVIFGSSSIMRWYTNNTCVIIDKQGNKQYGKIEPKLRKNDGFMGFVMAMSAEQLLDEIVFCF